MTNKEFGNKIIEYANESSGKEKEELIQAGKLLGEGEPFVLAKFLDSMEVNNREMFFQILENCKESN